ncbi:hypothetical protein [Streptomyces kebangsaanensis]|uniref:hypothetical protein n=1 Tax=Streptomyces kebangsaanensis TaxID=864058 RepID=UPI00093DF420|nr:hypothetical protein [Streptomyces kebangsaanensis]
MADLATVEDLEDRLGRPLTEDEAARAPALLRDATARVREFTGQTLSAVAGDAIVLRPVGSLLRLPQRPVTAVHSVAAVGPDGTTVGDLSGWVWDGRDKVDLTYATPAGSWPLAWRGPLPDTYRVTYDHGHTAIPEIIGATVCAMVLRTLLAPSMTPGLASERIGAYSYQLQQGAGSAGVSVVMTAEDEKSLRRYGPRRFGTIQVTVG